MEKVPAALKAFCKKVTTREEMLPLAGLGVLWMRAKPPLAPLILNFLDSVKDGVFVVDSLQGSGKPTQAVSRGLRGQPQQHHPRCPCFREQEIPDQAGQGKQGRHYDSQASQWLSRVRGQAYALPPGKDHRKQIGPGLVKDGMNFPEMVAPASRQLRELIHLQLAEFQESL